MAMIRALPSEFDAFTSSLMLHDKLDVASITQVFLTEETNRRRRAEAEFVATSSSSSSALATSQARCEFCNSQGHAILDCRKFVSAKAFARKPKAKREGAAKQAQESEKSDSQVTETAGNASLRSIHPSDPHSPLLLDAHADWNADTGATSHMTPHLLECVVLRWLRLSCWTKQ
ncbi:hypothetical protein PLICRDRAFT_670875 [Plicaturopsis crispa FD-325 SS-3]|uniref:CCHC-type domain-containing protein n=1 Tax=Plicaturopsis crispa FD-325 SS-3 TaxID=944288 RepID=A0A0C9SXY7_PLICR|nr:hypothetical protein PLICRDRAFT_670875 [Plicaturopsis crispa FD-325 SS-3]